MSYSYSYSYSFFVDLLMKPIKYLYSCFMSYCIRHWLICKDYWSNQTFNLMLLELQVDATFVMENSTLCFGVEWVVCMLFSVMFWKLVRCVLELNEFYKFDTMLLCFGANGLYVICCSA